MIKETKFTFLLAAIPFLTLVLALSSVNRLEPVILGLPFILFRIVALFLLTRAILVVAFRLKKKYNAAAKYSEK